jgi:hypothetical protein
VLAEGDPDRVIRDRPRPRPEDRGRLTAADVGLRAADARLERVREREHAVDEVTLSVASPAVDVTHAVVAAA